MLHIHGEKKREIFLDLPMLLRAMQGVTVDRKYAAHIQRDFYRA